MSNEEFIEYWQNVSDKMDAITNLSERVRNGPNLDQFMPTYTLSSMITKVRPIYEQLWAYFGTGTNFDAHITDFHCHLEDEKVDLSGLAIDPKVFGETVLFYLHKRRAEYLVEDAWYPAKKMPTKFPSSLVEKAVVDIDVGDGISPMVEILTIGDLYGSVGSLLNVLSSLVDKGHLTDNWVITKPDLFLVMMGNLGDKGFFGVETWLCTLYLLIQNPKQVFCLRGTHDYGAETDFRYDEAPLKLQLPINLFSRVIWRIADTFPEMLFFTTADLHFEKADSQADKARNYIVLTHGAIEPGYQPEAFLYHSCRARFHNVEHYDRAPFYEYLKRTQVSMFERIEAQDRFQDIPLVVRSLATAIKGGGPLWNSYTNGDIGIQMGIDDNGIKITRPLLESVFDYWTEMVGKSALKGKFMTLRRRSSSTERKRASFLTSLGGCGPFFVKTARKGKGRFAIFEKEKDPTLPAGAPPQFLIYKSTMALDVVPFQLDTQVVTSRVHLRVSGEWAVAPEPISDENGFYKLSGTAQEKFQAMLATQE